MFGDFNDILGGEEHSGFGNSQKNKMGNLNKKAREAFATLCKKQAANLSNPTPHGVEEEKIVCERWEK